VGGAVRQEISTRLQRLERLLKDSAVSAQCVLWRERGEYTCELTVHARGDHMLHSLGRGAQIGSAVTQAVSKVSRQAQRLKDRWKTRKRSGNNGTGWAALVETASAAEPAARVIRSKPYRVKPMSLDDALLALSGTEQRFLIFRHTTSDSVAVLYRREDGHFGLIEPEA
jgi:putative sigma-54 modulation protein